MIPGRPSCWLLGRISCLLQTVRGPSHQRQVGDHLSLSPGDFCRQQTQHMWQCGVERVAGNSGRCSAELQFKSVPDQRPGRICQTQKLNDWAVSPHQHVEHARTDVDSNPRSLCAGCMKHVVSSSSAAIKEKLDLLGFEVSYGTVHRWQIELSTIPCQRGAMLIRGDASTLDSSEVKTALSNHIAIEMGAIQPFNGWRAVQ